MQSLRLPSQRDVQLLPDPRFLVGKLSEANKTERETGDLNLKLHTAKLTKSLLVWRNMTFELFTRVALDRHFPQTPTANFSSLFKMESS
jgi:hypothetical protein